MRGVDCELRASPSYRLGVRMESISPFTGLVLAYDLVDSLSGRVTYHQNFRNDWILMPIHYFLASNLDQSIDV